MPQMLSLGLDLRFGGRAPLAAAPPSHTYGPELFPQPAFAGTAGLTLSGTPAATVSGGLLTFGSGGSGACVGAISGLVSGDTIHVVVTMTTSTDADITIKCGNAAGGGIGSVIVGTVTAGSAAGTYTFDKVVGSANISVALVSGVPSAPVQFSACSAKKQLT
jgi:hypothetical protein